MDAVPLITSVWDPRNLASLLFYVALGLAVHRPLTRLYPRLLSLAFSGKQPALVWDSGEARVMALALSLLILPFLPATNLFFYVGFVIAERVLYLPSLGYCLLLALALTHIAVPLCRSARGHPVTGLILAFFALQTLVRNGAWREEESLFAAGLTVNPAKSWSNYGNVLNSRGLHTPAAELAFKEALRHRPNMADTHYNLGVLFQHQGRRQEAVQAYRAAIRFRPKLGLAYLNLGLTLSELGDKSGAMSVLNQGSRVGDGGLKDPSENAHARLSAMYHLGKLLLEAGRQEAAITLLHKAANMSLNLHHEVEKMLNLLGEAYQVIISAKEFPLDLSYKTSKVCLQYMWLHRKKSTPIS